MKEIRFFYAPEAKETEELPQEEATHAIRVLRLQPGDEIFLMDGKGVFYRAEITVVTNKKCLYRIMESMRQEPIWRGHIHLAIAPTKMMDRIEWMVEKAVEIGFDEISFLKCRFSERTRIRTDRVEKIVVSAVKQSHKAWMPAVNDMQDFKHFISQPHVGRKFICHCYEEIHKDDFFSLITSQINNGVSENDDIIVLVGPEGDFSIEEVRMAIDNGYQSVTLGKSRLRTETAGLQAVAMSNLARRIL
ncbi:MAG: 16S rRNA (uracil(1498)-N(3))-methyltransferase [Prevotella sp.]|nr:16S rRNA (uracil(1498)-N(3))-methyltransferase [Prevotella sp.]